MNSIKLKTEYITLQQLLKIEDFISSGGEAKYYLAQHVCYVNGNEENRRGKKLYPGDKVVIENQEFLMEWFQK